MRSTKCQHSEQPNTPYEHVDSTHPRVLSSKPPMLMPSRLFTVLIYFTCHWLHQLHDVRAQRLPIQSGSVPDLGSPDKTIKSARESAKDDWLHVEVQCCRSLAVTRAIMF